MSVSNTLGYEGYPLPVGTIFPFIGSTLPNPVESGLLVCDGSAYSPTEWSDLFNALGYAYGQSGTDFRVPALNTADNSFLTGAAFTDPARQTGSVVLEAPAGRTLTAANIPSFSFKTSTLDSLSIVGTGIPYLTSGGTNTNRLSNNSGSAASGALIAVNASVNTGAATCLLGPDIKISHRNNTPTTLPDTQYSVAGDFNPQYVSVIYLIKARYSLPPLVSSSTPNVPPPTSNIYNNNKSLGGFTDFGGAIQFAYY
jgi:microcystin-dependent protein